MKTFAFALFAFMSQINTAFADWKKGWEIESVAAFDAKVIALQFQGSDVFFAGRLRHKYSLLALEINTSLTHGYGASILVDVVRVELLRLHLNAGVFIPVYRQMSVPDIDRSYDIALGAGVEVPIGGHKVLTLDWRPSFPEMSRVLHYGDLSRLIYGSALKEAPWLVGFSWRF